MDEPDVAGTLELSFADVIVQQRFGRMRLFRPRVRREESGGLVDHDHVAIFVKNIKGQSVRSRSPSRPCLGGLYRLYHVRYYTILPISWTPSTNGVAGGIGRSEDLTATRSMVSMSLLNALLLPNYDKLFDKGYVSFGDDGKIIYSPFLPESDRLLLGLDDSIHLLWLDEKHKDYLAYHREHCLMQ